jgi:thioester reductase-like protein
MPDNRPTMLLTGAAGVMGRALLDEFSADFDVVCLRHRSPIADPRVREVQGNLSSADLGLEPDELDALAKEVDVVVHGAASTNWRTNRKDIIATNVGGTQNMLSFARRADVPLYYISTAFVIRHTEPEEGCEVERTGPIAYVESKVMAEQAVRDSGLPAVIVRPSIVIGDSRSGQIAAFQGIHKVMAAILKNALPVLPADPVSLIDTVPQDVAARAIGRLVRERVTEGEFWLTAGEAAIDLADMSGITMSVAQELGYDINRPRMIPTEAVDRLLLPLMEEVIPPSLRRQFHGFNQLMMLFQNASALPCSLAEIGPDLAMTRAGLQEAYRRGVEYLAVRQGLAPAGAFGDGEAVA